MCYYAVNNQPILVKLLVCLFLYIIGVNKTYIYIDDKKYIIKMFMNRFRDEYNFFLILSLFYEFYCLFLK